jgi:uncharacterized protein (AIM24 family)
LILDDGRIGEGVGPGAFEGDGDRFVGGEGDPLAALEGEGDPLVALEAEGDPVNVKM